jgi:malate dehydrogenase (oxaloacetate-decarboxylating)(NADP+)
MIHKGHADGMICGTFVTTGLHRHYIDQVLGKRDGVNVHAAMSTVLLPNHQITIVDTHVNENPTAEQLAEIPLLAAEELQRVGISPKIALLSHSNFGSSNSESANKMRKTRSILRDIAPELEVDGEMHGDAALDIDVLRKSISNSTLKSDANLLVQPNIDAANISYNLLKSTASNGIAIGPILLGCAKPVHILTESATVRRIVNMTTLCVVDALSKHRDQN